MKRSPKVIAFIDGNDHWFLNLVMPAGKCACSSRPRYRGQLLVTVMARNGTDFGIRSPPCPIGGSRRPRA